MISETASRAIRAETEAFLDLYRAGAERWSTSHDSFDGVHVAWSPEDYDPAFSPVLNLSDARQKETTLLTLEQLGRERRMPRIGINGNPEIDEWASSGRASARGYELDSQELFWAMPLAGGVDSPDLPEATEVQLCSSEDADLFARTLNTGFGLPEHDVRGHVFSSAAGRGRWTHYLARIDGQPAATSALFMAGDVAQLFVTTTVPEFRGRGLQTYLIRRRLADALGAGCTLAITQTVTDNASPRNMSRQGFHLLYQRTIWGKRL